MPEAISIPDISIPTATTTTANSDMISFLIAFAGFIGFLIIVFAILWLIETRGNRLYWFKNGIMRKKRFSDKDITPEGFINASKEEAFKITCSPFQSRNMFGSANPSWFAVSPHPITLKIARPDDSIKYPPSSVVHEGINAVIMKELQTYHETTGRSESFILVILAGLVGLFGGVALMSTGILG
jgi:hypothetical protein